MTITSSRSTNDVSHMTTAYREKKGRRERIQYSSEDGCEVNGEVLDRSWKGHDVSCNGDKVIIERAVKMLEGSVVHHINQVISGLERDTLGREKREKYKERMRKVVDRDGKER